jgi:hypothetical protein
MLVCKLCGVTIKDSETMIEHKKNHHAWATSFNNQKDHVVEEW